MAPLLEVDDIHTSYGTIEALKGISLKVDEGEVVTLIGSNGAGKSTTLRSISGLTPPREGTIKFEGTEIGEVPPQEIVERGISLSPEGRHIFPRMSVRENLDLGAYLRKDRDGVENDRERVRADGQPAAPAARRAVDGHRPDPGRADLRDDRRDQPAGHHDPARGAERELRPRGVEAGLRARDRQGRARGRVDRAAEQSRRPEGLPGSVSMDLLAVIGSGALWLLYLWLASGIAASYLSARKGYGEKLGLAFGMLLSVVGVLVWLIWPPKPDSRWKLQGVFGSKGKTVAELRAEQHSVRGD